MADYLLDTNVLLRSCDPASPAHHSAVAAVSGLLQGGYNLYVTPQNVVESWVVATRPVDVRGLGWSPEKAAHEIGRVLDQFALLEESPGIFPQWFKLVTSQGTRGKRAHDARLVAVALAYGVPYLLTFNTEDFGGFPGIVPVAPGDAAEGP